MNYSSVSGKVWHFKKFNNSDLEKYVENYSLTEITARLLAIRKENIENVDLFLKPTIKNLLPNPLQLKDMDKAINRAYAAIKNKEIIGIFGDYDVDGATSTALLTRYFLSLKQNVKTYIPDRKKEGYGPTIEAFNNLINNQAKIIYTVDCGTLSFDPIKKAKEKSVDVIVLDHHQSEINLPKAYAIVNPNRQDDNSNLNYLCAAGVCFMFLVALNKKLRDENWFIHNKISEPNILNFLDLVSLGTICDVVPLIGLNRAIVKQGLQVLKKRSNLGLKTLYDLCKINSQPTTYDLGFTLGPRLNAGGRVGKSSHAVELLISDDPKKTFQIACDLEKYNNERKTIEKILTDRIFSDVKKFHNHPVIVLSGEGFHEGIIGIVASRIKDKYNKPTILISLNEKFGKGSARSIVGFDIGLQILNAVQLGIIEKGGGHKMAGGFTIKKEKIELLRNFLISKFEKSNIDLSEGQNLYLDSIIAPSAINEEFYQNIDFLAPFGPGNNEPKFAVENLHVIKSDIIKEQHIKSILSGKDGTSFKSFAWNAVNTPLEKYLSKKNKKNFTAAGKMKLNEWNGKKSIDFIIEDISNPN